MQGAGPRRTSATSSEGPRSAELAWTYAFQGTLVQDNASPIVDQEGTVYQPTESSLYAIRSNGQLKWRTKCWMRSSPALSRDGQAIYILENSGALRALSTATADPLWELSLDPATYSSVAVGDNGAIYAGTHTGMVAVTPDGQLNWRLDASDAGCWVEAPPAIDEAGNVFYIQNCVGLVSLDATGLLRWVLGGLGDYGWPTPSIGTSGSLYVAGEYYNNQSLQAVSRDGSPLWRRDDLDGPGFFPGVAVSSDGSTIYSPRSGGRVFALDASTGRTVWEATVAQDELGGIPALARSTLHVVGTSSVYTLDAETGDLLWAYALNSHQRYWGPQSPAIGPDGTLYVVSSGNFGIAAGATSARLYAFGSPQHATPVPSISPLTWRRSGLADTGVYRLATSPSAPRVVYAGTKAGGVYRSPDSGATWTSIGSFGGAPPVTALAVSPLTANDVYVGTYSRAYRSSDMGSHWLALSAPFGIQTMAIDPYNPHALWAGTGFAGGTYTSKDGGQSWSRVRGGDYVTAIVVSPIDTNTVYSVSGPDESVGLPAGAYRTRDAGLTWSLALEGEGVSLAVDLQGNLYAGVRDCCVLRSSDEGESWVTIFTAFQDITCIAVGHSLPPTVYVGTANHGVLAISDASWGFAGQGMGDYIVLCLLVDPTDSGRLYAGTDGGLYALTEPMLGDFDRNGKVDLDDFLLFTDAFGSTDKTYDIDRSGRVDFDDFFLFADFFGM